MNAVWGALLLLAVIVVAMVAFQALDRWHARYAWRKASEEAKRYMREVRGIEVSEDGMTTTKITPPPRPVGIGPGPERPPEPPPRRYGRG